MYVIGFQEGDKSIPVSLSFSSVCDINKVIHVFNMSLDNIIAVSD
jgi:hypothetical protein